MQLQLAKYCRFEVIKKQNKKLLNAGLCFVSLSIVFIAAAYIAGDHLCTRINAGAKAGGTASRCCTTRFGGAARKRNGGSSESGAGVGAPTVEAGS